MRSRLSALLAAAAVLLVPLFVLADEGMWPIDDLRSLPWKDLKARGLALSQKEIFDGAGGGMASAIVSLGGGTGSFVSSKGLILTNHHVAFGAIQRASTKDHNYLRDGFFASDLAGEVPALGYRASVILSIEDVTEKVLSAVNDRMSDLERYNAIEKRQKELVAAAEKGRDVECRIAEYYDGLKYKLFTFFPIKDVRLVYAPPEAIGNFGGDVDNWMWPRHTGDFSFLRAYVGKDGKSAEYAADNVPYEPRTFLPVSGKGVREGDFAMIVGFPGRTSRFLPASGISFLQEHSFPSRIKLYCELIGILQDEAKRGDDIAIKVAQLDQRLNNTMKNSEGQLEGFEKADLAGRKKASEKEFAAWLDRNPKAGAACGNALAELASLYEDQRLWSDKSQILGTIAFTSQMVRAATTLERWSAEKEKPDLERRPGYQERDVQRLKQSLRILQMSYDPQTDRRVLRHLMLRSLDLPAGQRIEAIDAIAGDAKGAAAEAAIDAFLDGLYRGTKLADPAERLRLFDLSRDELLAARDPFISFAVEINRESKAVDEKEHAFAGAMNRIKPRYISALREWRGSGIYPDANGTMRLTYGTVKGYSPRDAVSYRYATTLGGAVEKETGEDPFASPPKLLTLAAARDYGAYADATLGDVPVAFLATTDITGGNSGSPILNGKGEVVGAAFDGNWESISSDYLFNEAMNRTISVESRYILFVLDKMSGAKRLLDEMVIR